MTRWSSFPYSSTFRYPVPYAPTLNISLQSSNHCKSTTKHTFHPQQVREKTPHSHFTPYSFSIFSASTMAFLLLLYQMATFAPASAKACATDKPIPAPAPDTMAVLPWRENMGSTRPAGGATVLL